MELCAGLGGIGIGLRALGFEIAQAFDSWSDSTHIYNHNFEGGVAVTSNLMTSKGWSEVAVIRKKASEIELLAAGPPCKGFSRLRNGFHDGRNGHNRVLAAMPDYVGLLRPKMVLIENVPDLLRHRDGKTIASLVGRLKRPARGLRYRVEYDVYDASLFGTPQARKRVLIFCVREGIGDFHLPSPGPDLTPLYSAIRHGSETPRDLAAYLTQLRDPNDSSLVTASQALSDLPVLKAGSSEGPRSYASPPRSAYQRWARQMASDKLENTRTPDVNDETVERLKFIPPGGCARSIPKEHLNGLARRYDSAYRRLHPDAPSTALSTKYDCVYHYQEARSLSVREYARLQGIPDHFKFPEDLVCRRNAYEMIGNSVPPLLIERVFGAVLGSMPTEPSGR